MGLAIDASKDKLHFPVNLWPSFWSPKIVAKPVSPRRASPVELKFAPSEMVATGNNLDSWSCQGFFIPVFLCPYDLRGRRRTWCCQRNSLLKQSYLATLRVLAQGQCACALHPRKKRAAPENLRFVGVLQSQGVARRKVMGTCEQQPGCFMSANRVVRKRVLWRGCGHCEFILVPQAC